MLGKIEKKKGNLREAMKYDSSKSMYEYGKIHYKLYKVSGLDVDKEKAIEFYKKSIERGNFKAMLNYGIMIKDDKSLEPNNIEERAKFIKMSADEGYMKACFYYSMMLENGEFNDINKEEKKRYLKYAAMKGHIKSMYKYGLELSNNSKEPNAKKESLLLF